MPHPSPAARLCALLTTALAAIPVLTACSADAPTRASNSPRPSVASPAPAPTPPATRATVPAAARAHTNVGAQAFAKFYLTQVNKAWMEPDPELIRPYATKNCKSCANYVSGAESLKTQSHRFSGAPVTILSAMWLPESRRDSVLISVALLVNDVGVVDRDGTVVHRQKGASSPQQVDVVWDDGSRKIDAVRWVDVKK